MMDDSEDKMVIRQEVSSHQKVSALIEQYRSFLLMNCLCENERGPSQRSNRLPLLACSVEIPGTERYRDPIAQNRHQLQLCLVMAPIPKYFDHDSLGRVLTKEEAHSLVRKTETLGLVLITATTPEGVIYICTCCGCCCELLRVIGRSAIPASQLVNADDYAAIDPVKCTGCGVCTRERCQVHAIEESGQTYRINLKRCIGCGLCINTCPTDAIALIPRKRVVLQPHSLGAIRGGVLQKMIDALQIRRPQTSFSRRLREE
jgi:NAD-dependent dihydropyrimidine dehydrogenase PreA subunit